jgi:expansin (peptidoglycan-binding protein)
MHNLITGPNPSDIELFNNYNGITTQFASTLLAVFGAKGTTTTQNSVYPSTNVSYVVHEDT